MSMLGLSERAENCRASIYFLLAVFSMIISPCSVSAEAISIRRGVNIEAWQQWTNEKSFVADWYDRTNFPDWIKTVNDGQLKSLRLQGFDFVRLNVDPSVFFWKPTDKNIIIEQIVEATVRLQNAGFKVIVDMHLLPDMPDRSFGLHTILGTGGVSESGFQPYATLLTEIASRLDLLPKQLTALELINEPDQDWFSHWAITDRWPEQLGAIYRAARKGSKDLTLVLSGARGGGIDGLIRLDPSLWIGDPNVIWSFHFYEPFEITHSGLPWMRDGQHFLVGLPFPAELLDDVLRKKLLERARVEISTDIRDVATRNKLAAEVSNALAHYSASGASPKTLDHELARVGKWASDHGIPPNRILLGEFGVFQDKVSMETRTAILAATHKAAEKYGFAWAVYTAGLTQPKSSFSVIGDRETLKLEPEVARALGL